MAPQSIKLNYLERAMPNLKKVPQEVLIPGVEMAAVK